MLPRRAIVCAFTLAVAPVLMQCAHGRSGTGEQQPALRSPAAAQTRVFKDCADCPEMVEVAGGTFRMGLADWWTDNSTKPVHSVTVRPFAIGLREVTRNEYAAFAEATGRTIRSCTPRPEDNNAARCLTWYDATAYAEWLTSSTGQLYRLPTESEWEYVARGSDLEGVSRFGVRDLFTDVREWMADCHYPNYVGAPSDGAPWVEDPACVPRVVRGRDWPRLWRNFVQQTAPDRRKRVYIERYAAARGWHLAHLTTSTIGVRVARTLMDTHDSVIVSDVVNQLVE